MLTPQRPRAALWLAFTLFTPACAGAESPWYRLIAEADRLEVISSDADTWRAFGYVREPTPGLLADATTALLELDGIHGSLFVEAGEERRAIARAFAQGFQKEGPAALCYDPHHLLVVTSGADTVHIHLCFQCNYAVVLDKETTTTRLESFQDTGGLAQRLNRLLKERGIPVVPPALPRATVERDQAALERVLPEPIRKLMADAHSIELLSIDPHVHAAWGHGRNLEPTPLRSALAALQDGEGVMGRTALRRSGTRTDVLERLYDGIRSDGKRLKCYEPRHALLIGAHDEQVLVYLCFACNNLCVLTADATKGRCEPFHDVRGLQGRLNAILRRQGIPIHGEKP